MAEAILKLRQFLENETPRKFAGLHLNCIPSGWDPRNYQYQAIAPALEWSEIPDVIDYGEHLPDHEKRYEQILGTCTSSGIIYGPLGQQALESGAWPEGGLSVRYNYEQAKGLDGRPHEAGSQPLFNFKALNRWGVVPEKLYPTAAMTRDYDLPTPPAELGSIAARNKIGSYAQLAAPTDTDRGELLLRQIATALHLERKALVICVLITESWFDVSEANGWRIPIPAGRFLGGHLIRLSGLYKKYEAFKVRNTWGGKWANNDEAYLPFEWFTRPFSWTGVDKSWYLFEAWTGLRQELPRRAKKIVLTPGERWMEVDGERVMLDVPAHIDGDRIFLPIRATGNNVGYLVRWENGKAILIDPAAAGVAP
jgi:hypothetical protein